MNIVGHVELCIFAQHEEDEILETFGDRLYGIVALRDGLNSDHS